MTRNLVAAARGAAAGIVASAAMGLVFVGARRAGIVSTVAPEAITETALDALDVDVPEPAENALSATSHIAYGAGAGALYGLVHRVAPVDPIVGGLAFAGLVMVGSYQGWVPAVGALPPLSAQTRGGRWTLIAGHVVYGTLLGTLAAKRSNHRG